MEEFARTEAVLGTDAMEKLAKARVAVFGIGGVGGHAADALARSGIGAMDLFDDDTVSLSNINRQLVAMHSTLGRQKIEVMREHIVYFTDRDFWMSMYSFSVYWRMCRIWKRSLPVRKKR